MRECGLFANSETSSQVRNALFSGAARSRLAGRPAGRRWELPRFDGLQLLSPYAFGPFQKSRASLDGKKTIRKRGVAALSQIY
jgi:hypothetical protein